jgi:hypothetical protein
MKITSKPLACTLIGAFFLVLMAGIYLQVLWTDWAVQKIFNKDFHGFKIFLALFIIESLAPRAIKGITTIILILMTLYIFLIA